MCVRACVRACASERVYVRVCTSIGLQVDSVFGFKNVDKDKETVKKTTESNKNSCGCDISLKLLKIIQPAIK